MKDRQELLATLQEVIQMPQSTIKERYERARAAANCLEDCFLVLTAALSEKPPVRKSETELPTGSLNGREKEALEKLREAAECLGLYPAPVG